MGIYDSGNAAQADFFGETVEPGAADAFTGIEGRAPILTTDQIAIDRERKKQWLANQGLAEDGVTRLANYGTAAADGGTATHWRTLEQPAMGTGQMSQIAGEQIGTDGQPIVGSTGFDTTYQDGVANPRETTAFEVNPGVSITSPGGATANWDANGGGGMGGNASAVLGQTNQATSALRDGLAVDQQRTRDGAGLAIDDAKNMNPLLNRGLTQTAANQATTALGPAAAVDQGLADRGLADYQGAQASSRAVLDKLMNGPSTTARIGSQVLRNQLALSRSAAGGAGAGQMALQNAQAQAPELMAQAAQSAVAEDIGKTQAAGQVAAGQAQAALGARGQDVDVAKSNQAASMRLSDNIAQLTGTQLNLNQANQELVGRMFTDMSKQDFDWSKLSADAQMAELDRWAKVYGIDQQVMAQLKVAALANPEKGFLDYALPIIGGLGQLGMAAL